MRNQASSVSNLHLNLTVDEKHKEIDLIQSCIARMANNSFMCKGWLLSLIVAILALIPYGVSRLNICLLMLTIDTCFWCLDSFYLLQETLFRFKYEWVINNRNMNSSYLYDLNPYNSNMWMNEYSPHDRIIITKHLRRFVRFITKKLFLDNKDINRPYLIEVMFSKTVFPMYGCCFIVLMLLIIFKYS